MTDTDNKHQIIFLQKYKLLLNFYNHFGHSNIPKNFITIDGINKSKKGINLDSFVRSINEKYKNRRKDLTEEQLELLEKVEFKFEKRTTKRAQNFKALENYYRVHNNCNVPRGFKTNDGINESQEGTDLGAFVAKIRRFAKGFRGSLSNEEIKLLTKIEFDFTPNTTRTTDKYKLLLNFYNHYGHSNVPNNFITIDGINKDENGINLGNFVNSLKAKNNGKRPPFTQMQLNILETVQITFEKRDAKRVQCFKALENYYKLHNNCNIPRGFKTLDGVNESKCGIDLGAFVTQVRKSARGIIKPLSDEEYKILTDINFDFEPNKTKTSMNYNMLLNFYQHYNHLEVPLNFITKDGITRDETGENLGYFNLTLSHRYKNNKESFSNIETIILEQLNYDNIFKQEEPKVNIKKSN